MALIREHLGREGPMEGVDEGDLVLALGHTRMLGRKAEMRRVVAYLVNAITPSDEDRGSACFVELHVLPPGEQDPANAEFTHEPITAGFGGPYRVRAGGKAYDLQFVERGLYEWVGDRALDLRAGR